MLMTDEQVAIAAQNRLEAIRTTIARISGQKDREPAQSQAHESWVDLRGTIARRVSHNVG